jgi:hypothetical protein
MTAMLAVVQISARAVVCAGSIVVFFAHYLLADGYPMKVIKITYLR